MRIREKRKLQREQRDRKEQREQKDSSKAAAKREKSSDVEVLTPATAPAPASAPAPPPASATSTAATTTPPTSGTPPAPSLPAAEKVAFDNRIKRKNVLALNEKVAALREYDRLPVYKHVGRMFNCSPDQIKRIVQQRQEILNAWEQRTRRSQDARTMETKTVRVSMLGKAVYDWIRRMMYYKDFSISDGLIQKMALQFKSSMGLAHFFPHQEWCDKFRRTYSIHHSDTKQLKIGYTQSYSVQIKDIVKDVMSECMPEGGPNNEEEEDEEPSLGSPLSSSNHRSEDEDDDVDVDGGDISGREDDLDEEQDIKPSLTELNLSRAIQPLPPLVRLPLQTNTPPGTSQKVLLATPIVPPQAAGSGQPMTMTIIPLATLAQSITQIPLSQQKQVTEKEKGPAVPPPKLEIKQEKDIKTEPCDPEEFHAEPQQQQQEEERSNPTAEAQTSNDKDFETLPMVHIKQEPEAEPEADMDPEVDDPEEDANNGRSSVTSLAEVLAANVEDEMEYIEQMRQRKMSSPPTIGKPSSHRQGTKRRHESAHDDNNNGESGGGRGSVISCADARKYLKLLEEFALYKENYRLIGLITRADEVMREMDDGAE
ncbi:hypothetical protein KR059_009196 [Drosophila kikkawai]|nr:hypothetical protein KR059_009196 [Drosophila kikkawai]